MRRRNLQRVIASFAILGVVIATNTMTLNAKTLLQDANYDMRGMLNIYKENKDTLVVNGIQVTKDYISRNFSTHRKKIEYIVIHDTDNREPKADAEMHSGYYQSNSRGASAHYTVDDDSIVNNVREEDSAYHCGDGYGKNGITNSNSIGIEMCVNSDGDFSKTMKTTEELAKHLMSKYDIPPERVVMHRDASGKNCSRKMIEEGLWDDFKRAVGDTNYGEDKPGDQPKGDTVLTVKEDTDVHKDGSWVSEVVQPIKTGATVKLLSQDSQWSKVKLGAEFGDKEGYILNTTLAEKEIVAKGDIKTATYLRVSKNWSETPYDVIVKAGDKVNVYEQDKDWVQISVNGTYGYIASDMITITEQIKK
ncbi:hypothetical protein UT300012_24680 [Paraclostridium bifermentans]